MRSQRMSNENKDKSDQEPYVKYAIGKDGFDPLIEEFNLQVMSISDEVDPSNRHFWESIALGWALAKGLSPDDAQDFSRDF